MIPILSQNFDTILGKLGAWPSDVNSECAEALYNICATQKPQAVIADIGPNFGKATVISSAGAMRSSARVVAVKPLRQANVEDLWFNRAVHLFRLNDHIQIVNTLQNVTVDVAIVHGDERTAKAIYGEGLKIGGALFGVNLPKLDGIEPEAHGHGWAVWRKGAQVPSSVAIELEDRHQREVTMMPIPSNE